MTREPLAEVKFRKPVTVTKHGYPSQPRGDTSTHSQGAKYCNMALLHEQEYRRNGVSVSDKSGIEAAYAAMSQTILRK